MRLSRRLRVARGARQIGSSVVVDGPSGFVSATRWRLYITATNGASLVQIGELNFYDIDDVDIPTTGGTPSASTTLSSFVASKAFDGSTTDGWASTSSGMPQWLEMEFLSSVEVHGFGIGSWGTNSTQHPRDYNLQYHDGSVWVDIGPYVTGETSWTSGEERTYSLY